MAIRLNVNPVPEIIKPQNVLVSVYDKDHLDKLVFGLAKFNPEITFYSTGGTGKEIVKLLSAFPNALTRDVKYIPVEEFTGMPEMEGGLVKTIHPKIAAGLLGERGNPHHQRFFNDVLRDEKTGRVGVYLDMVVNTLYPFQDVVAKLGTMYEEARANKDIGGIGMLTAAAKNWHSVTVLSEISQYDLFLDHLKANRGTKDKFRFELSVKADKVISDYRQAISDFNGRVKFERDVEPYLIAVRAFHNQHGHAPTQDEAKNLGR